MPNKSELKLIESAIRKIVNKVQAESKVNKNKKLTEAVMGVNLPLPNCNLYVKGWGMDKNGNSRIVVGFPNDKGFSIQTNGTLPETNHIIKVAHREMSEDELMEVGNEVLPYVQKYGPATVKSRLKVYGK